MRSGEFLGEFPYVRVGNGPRNLVVLPGLTPDNEAPNWLARQAYRFGFRRFADDYTLYRINRRRGLPSGYTTRDMAADYARVVERELGPSYLMGFSTGGLISQYLALDNPELVRRLVLVVTASRMSEAGRQICRHWQALARAGRWRELYVETGSVMVAGETKKRLFEVSMRLFGKLVVKPPAEPSDFLTTLAADLDHDTTDRLPEIGMPTLVIGGSEDVFFPALLLRETAGKIPDAELRIYAGTGHGAMRERKSRFEDDVLAFLESAR
jgi:pimeloyl-ACP methyl ester carboxylesterase